MKISKSALILSTAGLGLTLVYCGQSGKSDGTSSKAEQILHEKMAELKGGGLRDDGSSLPTKNQLLSDVERLHGEGKISDEQFTAFKKNINEQYSAFGAPVSPEAQAIAERVLQQKTAEINSNQKVVVPATNPETQTKAQRVLDEKLRESQTQPAAPVAPARADTDTAAQQALRAKIAELNTPTKQAATPSANSQPPAKVKPAVVRTQPPVAVPRSQEKSAVAEQVLQQRIAAMRTDEKTNIIPSTTTTTLTPEMEIKARELLHEKIAGAQGNEPMVAEAKAKAPARSVAQLNERNAEVKAGITPNSSESTRVLRAKIAELNGTVTPAEAQKIAATPQTPPAVIAPSAINDLAAPIPYSTSNKEGLAKLEELTVLYKADKVTPYQYHHERAKIVASL